MLSTVETWFTNRSWRASYRIPCPISGMELISSFCESHEIKAFWTANGDIGFRIEDPDAHDYAGDATFRTPQHVAASPTSW